MGYTPVRCQTMQRQYSRDRKTAPISELLAPRPMPGLSGRPWPIAGCSLAACLLIGLMYLLQSSIFFGPLILPGRHHQNIQEDEAIIARPRIELHPEQCVPGARDSVFGLACDLGISQTRRRIEAGLSHQWPFPWTHGGGPPW